MKTHNVILFIRTMYGFLLNTIIYIFPGIPLLITTYIYPKSTYKMWQVFSICVLWSLDVRVVVKGEIPKDRNYLIIANHQSFLDIFITAVYFNGAPGTVFLHKKFFWFPILNLWIQRLDVIPINPKSKKGIIHGMKKAVKILKGGKKHVVLFPEGTRTLTGEVQDFKPGMFKIAKDADVSIIPVGISGAYKIKPKNRFILMPGTVYVNIGEPFIYQDHSRGELISFARDKVIECMSA